MPFEELKARRSVVWGTGPYENVSATIADLQDELVARLEVLLGDLWRSIFGLRRLRRGSLGKAAGSEAKTGRRLLAERSAKALEQICLQEPELERPG